MARRDVFTTRPELKGTFGMVSSTHWLASAVGMAVLEAGGNAIDGAVAAGFTLQVAEPHLNGPGGDMTLLFAGPDGVPTVLCGQGSAPAGATAERFAGLTLIPGAGPLAAAVPGSTLAWLTLLRDHGTMPLRAVLEYAIHYARQGIPVLPSIADTIAKVSELFRTEWTTSARVYLPGDAVPKVDELFANPVLADTYERLLGESEKAGAGRERQIEAAISVWSAGFIAEAIAAFSATSWMDSSGERHAGLLTAADLAEWRPSYEAAVTHEFGEWTVAKTGPWGQGPVLLQQLALLDGLDIQPGSAEFVHTVVEVAKLAFADREAWYGDAAEVPLEQLLAPEYTAQRRMLIGDIASTELRPGAPGGRPPHLPAETPSPPVLPGTGEPTVANPAVVRGDTCHVDVVDRWGTMVAAMPSGGWLQSSPVIPELGFPLGTRLQMAWLQQGLPNSLTSGRRPRTTLSPSIALRGGKPVLAFGTPGGDQQDQWQLGFFLNHVLGGMDLQAAIDAPAFHTTHFPSSFYPRAAQPGHIIVEERMGEQVIAELRQRGHQVTVAEPWSLARMCAVARDPETGILRAAANPRGMQGYAAGR